MAPRRGQTIHPLILLVQFLTSDMVAQTTWNLGLILGGCCPAVITIEDLNKSLYQANGFITAAQFFVVALVAFFLTLERAPSSHHTIASSHTHASSHTTHHATGSLSRTEPPLHRKTESHVYGPKEKASTRKMVHFSLGPYTFAFPFGNVPLSRWFILVLLFFSSSVLANLAFDYAIPMPFHIIFRSGSLLVTLVMSYLIMHKR